MRHTVGHCRRRLVAAALVLVPAAAAAQLTPAVDATVGPARAGGESSTPLGALSPAVRVDLSRFAANASGDLPLTGALHGVAGRAAFTAGAPLGGGWRVVAGAAGERGARWAGLATWRAGLAAQLAYTRGAGGVWGGVEAARVASVEGALPFRGLTVPGAAADSVARPVTRVLDPAAYRTTALSLGAWRSVGSWVGAVALRSGVERVPGVAPHTYVVVDSVPTRIDTIRVGDSSLFRPSGWTRRNRTYGDSGTGSAIRRLSEAETRVAWTHGHVALVGAAGVRLADWAGEHFSQGPNTARLAWATLDATVALGRFAAVTLGAGTRPPAADVATMLAGASLPAGGRARYASVGLRLSSTLFQRPSLPPAVRPSAATFALAPAAERGQYSVRVKVPAARVVELSGDFTKWHPVVMQRVSADEWEAVLPIARGTHHVSIRVDGDAWAAPPGLARVADDFDGSAGVLVVP